MTTKFAMRARRHARGDLKAPVDPVDIQRRQLIDRERSAEAAAELDKVAAVDKDYPGLSLERGLLFEESGDVQKAIEQATLAAKAEIGQALGM